MAADPYAHLAIDTWSQSFLSNPHHRPWFDNQIALSPIAPGMSLVDYVREKIAEEARRKREVRESFQTGSSNGAAGTFVLPNPYAPPNQQQQMRLPSPSPPPPTTTTTNYNDVSDFLDLSSYPDDTTPSTASPFTYGSPFAPTTSSSSAPYGPPTSFFPSTSTSYSHSYITPSSMSIDPSLMGGRGPVLGPFSAPVPASTSGTAQGTLEMQRKLIADEQARIKLQEQEQARAAPSVVETKPIVPVSRAESPLITAPKKARSTLSPAPVPPPPSSTETPWSKLLPDLLPLLSLSRFQKRAPHSHVSHLASRLSLFTTSSPSPSSLDASEIPVSGRKLVLESVLAGMEVDKEWAKVWCGEEKGMEVVVQWLMGASAGVMGREKEKKEDVVMKREREKLERETLVLVLKFISKLPLTIEHLVKYRKIGGRVKKISEKSTLQEAQTIATMLTNRWMEWQKAAQSSQPKEIVAKSSAGSEGVKRKGTPEVADGPAKKPKVAAKPSSVVATAAAARMKVPAPPAAPAPSYKGSLPSFKKAVKAEPSTPPVPLVTVPPPHASGAFVSKPTSGLTSSLALRSGKGGKEKKKLRWAEEKELVKIKWIEKAVYGDENGEEVSDEEEQISMEDARGMEQQEGQTLSMHLEEDDDDEDEEEIEEEIEFYEPIPIEFPLTKDFESYLNRPSSSKEVAIQTSREANVMAVDSDPELLTASEAPEYTTIDPPTVSMHLSPDLREDQNVQRAIAHAQSTGPIGAAFAPADQLNSLLSQLKSSGTLHQIQQMQQMDHLDALKSYDPDSVARTLRENPSFGSSSNPSSMYQQQTHNPSQMNGGGRLQDNGWGGGAASYSSAWGNSYNQPPQPSWQPHAQVPAQIPPKSKRRGAKKGRNKNAADKVETCKFFAMKKGCDWGDKCQYLHDRGDGRDARS